MLLVVGVAWAATWEGDVPEDTSGSGGEAVLFYCDGPEYGVDPDDATTCTTDVPADFSMKWGISTALLKFRWRGDPGSGWWRELTIDRGSSNYYGPTTGDALFCVSGIGTGWATKYVPEASISGGYSNFSHPTATKTYSGDVNGYIFMIAPYTYSDPGADCAAADPGAPATGPATNPWISVDPSGTLEEGQAFDVILNAPDHDGEDVTCTLQTQAASDGTVASGTFEAFSAVTLDSGIYGAECSADDGVFDDTDPEIGSVRLNITVGAGLSEIIDGGCGAWYNIGCHLGAALVWAFVPDGDVLYEMWDDITEATEETWPLGPLVSSVALVGDILVDFGRGAEEPGYYLTSGLHCSNGSTSEACTLGICLGCDFSEGGAPWTDTIPLGPIDFPETRVLGMPEEGTSLESWAGNFRSMFSVLMIFGAARIVIALAVSIMGRGGNPGDQLQFNSKIWGGE